MALVTLKIAVFAPIPSARVRTATTVNTGFRNSCRNPKRISCQNEVMDTSIQVFHIQTLEV